MSITVCLSANALYACHVGGHLWVYLNWALGLRSLGCRVIWLEALSPRTPPHKVMANVEALKAVLKPYGLADSLALWSVAGTPLPPEVLEEVIDLEVATGADLLLNQRYNMRPEVVRRFRRSALLDIDPGLLQLWVSAGSIQLAPHDLYFTIGETVGGSQARFPDLGIRWQYTAPAVFLDSWPCSPADADAPFTTVSSWYAEEWMEDDDGVYRNDKRTGFLPYLDLPRSVVRRMELAVSLGSPGVAEPERRSLCAHGWSVQESLAVASTPWDYQRYIQRSFGEFSCVKPSCVRLQNAWISDRTLCYLASGKPAVVQHTGPSRFLPDADGLFRFTDLEQAARYLAAVEVDYPRHSEQARALAREYFDARRVITSLLERALA